MDESIEVNKVGIKNKKRKVNIWGVYISLCFIIIGVVWYGVNIGIIPLIIHSRTGRTHHNSGYWCADTDKIIDEINS